MGGGKPRASTTSRPAHRRSCAPASVIPASPASVIPAQAGIQAASSAAAHRAGSCLQPIPALLPNSSLPPGRGEVRWGVGSRERLPSAVPPTVVPALPPPSFLRSLPSFLRRQESRRPPAPLRASTFRRPPKPPPRRRPPRRLLPTANTHPFPNSSLPPSSRPSHNPRIQRCRPIVPIWSGCRHPAKFGVVRRSASRGEVRWGVGRRERLPPVVPPTVVPARPASVIPALPPVIPAQAGIQAASSAAARRNIPTARPSRLRAAAHRAGSCLRRNDGSGAAEFEAGVSWTAAPGTPR